LKYESDVTRARQMLMRKQQGDNGRGRTYN
jgi:hypothetical protein